jgi:hypothetical protein
MSYSDGELLFICEQEARTAVGATPLLPTTSAGSSRWLGKSSPTDCWG